MKLPPFQALLDEHRADVYRFLVATVGPSNLRAWLFRIAQNKSIDAHRARGRRAIPVATVPERATPSLPEGDPELWARLRDLPTKQRTAVFCRSVLGMPYDELALLLESSEDAARRNVHEGLKRLKEELS